MSVNIAIEQTYLAEVDALSKILERYLVKRRDASTRSEKALVEAESLELFQRLMALEHKVSELFPGDYLDYEELKNEYDVHEYLQIVIREKLRRLVTLFLNHYNSQQYALADLTGRFKRIRQKKAALALWSGDDAKFVLSEKFLNLDWLDEKYSSETSCYVATEEGALLLPIAGQQSVNIKTATIGSGSNGNPGNSDVDVTTNNINPNYALNSNPNNWFEYERLDSGPLQLNLVIELSKAEIVNNISLKPLNIGQAYSYLVEDVIFSSIDGGTVGIRDLIGEPDRERMLVRAAGNDSRWSLTFVPVYAKTITIKLKQDYSYTVAVAAANGGATDRRRYAIGISRLGVNQIRFESVGEINSVERPIDAGLYIGLPYADVWPPKPDLFDAVIEVSFDGGNTWEQVDDLADDTPDTVLMDGQAGTMIWRLRLLREDEALDQVTSFYPEQSDVKEIAGVSRVVSLERSPVEVSLLEQPADQNVFVFQPRIARRGAKRSRVYLGQGTGTAIAFELPFSPLQSGIDYQSMKVYANGVQYTYQEDNLAVSANEWSFSDDFSEIEFSSSLPDGARVQVLFDEERMLFKQEPGGYYHAMDLLFDPEKSNIEITFLPRVKSRNTMILPRDKKVIDLPGRFIEDTLFTFESSNGTTYTQVFTRADLLLGPRRYMVDGPNGILRLGAELDNDSVRVSYEYQDPTVLDATDYDIVYDQDSLKPVGIRIHEQSFQATEVTDVVGSAAKTRLDPITGEFESRYTPITSASGDAISLTQDYIIEGTVRVGEGLFDRTYVDEDPQEVAFIDGKTEFLGLIKMDTEATVETTAAVSATTVSFKLAAGALWYDGWPVSFSDTTVFGVDVGAGTPSSTGQYKIEADGTITVYVGLGGTLAGNISYYYYYRDPDFEPNNKYSVDYREGVLYGGSTLVNGTEIKYKSSSHKVAYDVAKEIDEYSYSSSTNSVSIRTENLERINKRVKVLWSRDAEATSLANFREYFSPIVSALAFRFN